MTVSLVYVQWVYSTFYARPRARPQAGASKGASGIRKSNVTHGWCYISTLGSCAMHNGGVVTVRRSPMKNEGMVQISEI
jgi:hypothetical protein